MLRGMRTQRSITSSSGRSSISSSDRRGKRGGGEGKRGAVMILCCVGARTWTGTWTRAATEYGRNGSRSGHDKGG